MENITVEIDAGILEEAMRLTGINSSEELVTHALQELVKREKRKKILELEGKVAWNGDLSNMRGQR